MFASRSKVLAATLATTFATFAFVAPVQACDAPGATAVKDSAAASVECKRARQFEIFKRQLAMTDGGGNYLSPADTPKECATQG
jgi:hypothetical protein